MSKWSRGEVVTGFQMSAEGLLSDQHILPEEINVWSHESFYRSASRAIEQIGRTSNVFLSDHERSVFLRR